jgi:hypothetical protein
MSACGCGCGRVVAARSVSAYTRRKLRRAVGFSRAIGDAMSDASSLAQTFHATDYVPASVQNDYATGVGYYQQFQNATAGASVVNGTVQLSDQASDAVLTTLVTTVAQMVPVLGQAFAVFMALAPKAGPGPGTCADPPAGPAPNQLRAWPHYTSWAKFFGAYPQAAAGTFEAFANPILQYNWELGANCFQSQWVPAPGLLAMLVASWNATHAGPSRTITRTGLNPTGFGLPKGYDPIASALEDAVIAKSSPAPGASTGPISWSQSEAQTSAAPHNVSSSFTVNSGPLIVKTITLKLTPKPTTTVGPAVKAVAPAPATSGSTAALVATVALAGACALWIFTRRRKHLPVVPRNLAKKLPKPVRRAFRV